MQSIKANFEGRIRRETHDGREHLVVPVVMIVDGVMNGALVTAEEYAKFIDTWNGRPVSVLHPEKNGTPVSAAQPDIIEKNTIGVLFNTQHVDGKLRSEAWIDLEKAERTGNTELVSALESGDVVEVSTGYFSDSETVDGVFNGERYREIHRNIRPDHLALLPGDIGACSVADGCGTRVNRRFAVNVKQALDTLARAVGIKSNCCGGKEMEELIKKAEELKANGSLTAKQFKWLQEMDDEQKAMVKALLDALSNVTQEEDDEDDEEDEREDNAGQEANGGGGGAPQNLTQENLAGIVSNQVAEHIRRTEVTRKLVANEQCPFTEDEMKTMSVEHLEKLEKSIRPTDYSGQGGYSGHSADSKPLTINRGVLAPAKKEA
jgi:hypothetical protein